MSELVSLSSSEPATPPGNDMAADTGVDVSASVSAGALLRQAREAAGLHIAALAVALKVPVKKLEALEADRFDLLPDAVFVRALAASVCRTLKIDSTLVFLHLPKTIHPRLTYQGAGINAPFRAPSGAQGPSVWVHLSRPAVLAGVVLLLGALVLILLPTLKTNLKVMGSDAASGTTAGPDKAAQAVAAAPAPLAEPVPSSGDGRDLLSPKPSASSAAALLAEANLPLASVPAAPVVTLPLLAAAAVPPAAIPALVLAAPAVAASSAVQSQASGTLVFTAKGESWVEVTDSRGMVVLRRTLGAGDVAGVSGVMPLTAVVGRADATLVQVRGKTFDLAAFAKDNVARFEVK